MSLFDVITKSETAAPYAATAVSNALIKIVGQDVCGFRRNTQTSYRIVEHAATIRAEIDALIKKVEDGSGDWDAYDDYTAAIDPLEE